MFHIVVFSCLHRVQRQAGASKFFPSLAQLTVAGDDLLKRRKAVQKVLL